MRTDFDKERLESLFVLQVVFSFISKYFQIVSFDNEYRCKMQISLPHIEHKGDVKMGVSAVSGATTVSSSQNDSSSAIKTLENQKQQLQNQITTINKDKTASSEEKEKKVQALQVRIQAIDIQIQQLQDKAEEKQKNQTQQSTATTVADTQSASSKQQLIQQKIDLEA